MVSRRGGGRRRRGPTRAAASRGPVPPGGRGRWAGGDRRARPGWRRPRAAAPAAPRPTAPRCSTARSGPAAGVPRRASRAWRRGRRRGRGGRASPAGSAPSSVGVVGGHAAVLGAAEAGEDLAADGVVPVAERDAHRGRIGRPRPALEDPVLVAPEHLGVLRVGEGGETGVGREGGRRPLPHVTEHLVHAPGADVLGVGPDRRRSGVALTQVAPGGLEPDDGGAARGGGGAGRLLPLGLGGQALAGPPGEGVGLVPAHVLHRLVEVVVEVEALTEAQDRPTAVALGPPELRVLELGLEAPGVPRTRPQPVVVVAAGAMNSRYCRLVTGTVSMRKVGRSTRWAPCSLS